MRKVYDAITIAKWIINKIHPEPWINSREGLDPDERSDKTINKLNIANYFTNEIFEPDDEAWN